MTPEEQFTEIRALLASLAAAVVHHDNQIEAHDRQIEALISLDERERGRLEAHDRQIEALIALDEKQRARLDSLVQATEQNSAQIAEVSRAVANLERQWQAYINTLP